MDRAGRHGAAGCSGIIGNMDEHWSPAYCNKLVWNAGVDSGVGRISGRLIFEHKTDFKGRDVASFEYVY